MAQRKTLTLKTKPTREPTQKPIGKKRPIQLAHKEKPEETPQDTSAVPPVPKKAPTSNPKISPEAQAEQKRAHKAARQAAINAYEQYLIEKHPELFGNHPKPLKIHIHKDMLKTRGPHSYKMVRFFMSRHVRRPEYLQALIEGGPRYDLNNQPAGTVTEQQQQIAQQALEKRKAKSTKT